ncbi:unnamed protein product [Caenorhabditis brenneri]
MNGELLKVPEMSKELNLPADSVIGNRVRIEIGEMLGLYWTGYWTVLNTAKGQFELKCDETSLCRWEIMTQLDIKMTGEGQTPELISKHEVKFSPKTKLWKMSQLEQGRKYNKVQLKITRKSSFGVHSPVHINFEKRNKWLDVKIISDDGKNELYANSGVLALNSPILRKQFEKGNDRDIVIESKSFPALRKLISYLHPPFTMEKDKVEDVLELVVKWKMDCVLAKYEEFLIRNRSFGVDASVRNIKLADKFKLKNLLEEVLWNDSSSVYALLEGNTFSTWARAAMFEFLLEIEDDSFQEDDDENDDDDDDDDEDSTMSFEGF